MRQKRAKELRKISRIQAAGTNKIRNLYKELKKNYKKLPKVMRHQSMKTMELVTENMKSILNQSDK